jgi:probable F420-dependent oxidoreductase
VKIRIGYGLGTATPTLDGGRFGALVDSLDELRFDSLWLSERVTGDCPDPMVGLSFAAGRSTRLKLGTSVQVLPGRNLHLLAKAWASLDRLTGGRCLPAFGLGIREPREQAAFGVERGDRARLFDEGLPKLRRLWAGEEVDGATISPLPVQSPMDVWLGGAAPAELRRVGRLGDGWLPSFCTPGTVAQGRPVIEAEATAHGRAIDGEHWGALVPYLTAAGPLPDRLVAIVEARSPGVDAADVVPSGFDALRTALEKFIAVEVSKFVLIPIGEPDDWPSHLRQVADATLDLVN